ncbi:MAG: hypothetical protein FWC01_05835 [Treponema sp.]|nr:hypothetical protein [Treponema sp.]MCL2237385.1 hypothetical protein [Treponema sp.]
MQEKKLLAMTIWRFAPLLTSIVWLFDYIIRIYTNDYISFSYMIITPDNFFIPCIIIGIMFILTFTFPYQFYIHGIFCWLFGLIRLIDGGLVNALLIHLLGYVFFFRQGFFRKNKIFKIIIGILIIIAAIVSQNRFDKILMMSRILHFSCSAVIIFISFIILNPEIQIIKKKMEKMTLVLQPNLFTQKDSIILQKILAGEKYETIANDEGMALSTLKKQIKRMFNILKINDRTCFLSLYANYKIVIDDKSSNLI